MGTKKIPLRLAWYGLILLASLLPAVVLTPWLSQQAHQLLLDRAMLREEVFHKEIETRLNMETERLVSVLTNKSDPIAYFLRQGNHAPFIAELLQKISRRNPVINSSVIYDPQGRIVQSYHRGKHAMAAVDSNSVAFVVPMHKRIFIGSPARLSDHHYEFLISVPLIYGDELTGVMISTVNVNDFWQSIRSHAERHQSQIYLVDGHGALMNELADSRRQQGDLLSSQAIVRALLAHKDWHKSESYSGIEATNVFGIGTQVERLTWGIISEIPAGNINAPIISALMTLSVIVIVLHLVFGLLGLLFTGRLLNPISELAGIMQRAKGGDYHLASGASMYREIDTLSSSFNTMIQEI
ncbi:MAG: cache domain-containing protein, partial [Mariprofundus sp.]